jgi:hypothetical protein
MPEPTTLITKSASAARFASNSESSIEPMATLISRHKLLSLRAFSGDLTKAVRAKDARFEWPMKRLRTFPPI